MDIQRLRNLTTRFLHTEMAHIYEDLGAITGEDGIMTHMIPRVLIAIEPWLRTHVKDDRFWDRRYDPTHTGEFALQEPTKEERELMLERYEEQPNPLAGKQAIVIECN